MDIEGDTRYELPKPQSLHFSPFGSMARDPLYDNLARGRRYQQSSEPIITGRRATDASPYHFHEAAFDSPTWGRPPHLSYEPPSSLLARDSRLRQLRELARDIEVFNPDSPGSNIEIS